MEQNNAEVKSIEIGKIFLKYRVPEGEGRHPVIMMFHGWTGDEDSMWIFAAKMPSDAILIAPRGLHSSSFGGYSWYSESIGEWPELTDYQDAISAVESIQLNGIFSNADFTRFRMVGFSQGAALSYCYALTHPQKVRSIAGLSGFVPNGVDTLTEFNPLVEMPIFIAHGTQDQLVPVERARAGVEVLQRAGARVSYCEDDVGHKLSASCYRGMQEFLRRN